MMGNNTKALELFQKAISLNPNFGGAWFNAGIALQSMGNKDQAVESYKKAARLGHTPAIEFLKSQGIGWQ
jgi:tetratricopeptide (TPR) repeat protein